MIWCGLLNNGNELERKNFTRLKSCKLHYLVTVGRIKFTIFLFIRLEMKSYKELLVILVLEARHSYCDKKLKLKSSQKVSNNKIQMIVKNIWPLCRLSAKDTDSKECYTQFGLIMRGNSLIAISISHVWFYFDDKMERLKSISLYWATFRFKVWGLSSKWKSMLKFCFAWNLHTSRD